MNFKPSRSFKPNRKLVIGAATIAVLGGAGGAYAAAQGASGQQALLNDAAQRLHVTPAQLRSALLAALGDRIDAAVASGRLTAAQGARLKQRLQATQGLPLLDRGLHGPRGELGPLGPLMGGHFRAGPLGGALDAAASYLGLSDAQLGNQLAAGRSLAQIAGQRGKSVNGLEQAILAAVRSRLDTAVANHRITGAQEQQILKSLSARIAALVQRPGLRLRMRIGPNGHRPGVFAPGVAAPDGPPVGGVLQGLPVPPDGPVT